MTNIPNLFTPVYPYLLRFMANLWQKESKSQNNLEIRKMCLILRKRDC